MCAEFSSVSGKMLQNLVVSGHLGPSCFCLVLCPYPVLCLAGWDSLDGVLCALFSVGA